MNVFEILKIMYINKITFILMFIIPRVLVLVGSLATASRWLVQENKMYGFIGVIIGLAALYLMMQRDYYLPFLGECVYPVVSVDSPVSAIPITIAGLPPNVRVVYWAAQANDKNFSDFKLAYADFSNSGLTKSGTDGVATLHVQYPSRYSVPMFGVLPKQLNRHVHYRYELPESTGMFSRVFTKNI